MKWETVIGLEVHVQLNTKSKLFSPAPNRFGDEPNTNIAVVCTGQPGALPVLNKAAVDKAIMFGCAVGADIAPVSRFDRKSYFYPDSPRNFQITQFFEPIVIGGQVTVDVGGKPKTFTITHAHLEDDAGMLKHFSSFAGVDYNRAGTPLIEIVSDPCMRSPQEAAAYGRAIRAICQYLDISDCNMEEGSLRMDANVSVRPVGSTELRTKMEIKNMNSFTFMEMALAAEVKRQIREYEANPDVQLIQSTYRWDPERKETVLMRKKEDSDDYRYFPEPDLLPTKITSDRVEKIRATLPELPFARLKRYMDEHKLNEGTAAILTEDKLLADYFEEALQTANHPRQVANWITGEFFGRIKDSGKSLTNFGIPAAHIGTLVALIVDNTITGKIAKAVADEMVLSPGKDPKQIIAENPDFQPVSDTGEIEALVDAVIAEQAPSVADYRAGKTKAFGFLMGQVMQKSSGKAPPNLVNQLLKQKLEA